MPQVGKTAINTLKKLGIEAQFVDNMRDVERGSYENGKVKPKYRDKAMSELFANFVGSKLGQGDVDNMAEWLEDLQKKEPKTANKFIAWLRDLFNKIRSALSSKYAEQYEFKKFDEMFANLLKTAQPNINGEKQYSIKQTKHIPYFEQLNMIEKSNLNGSNSLYVGVVSNKLQNVGISNNPFVMNQSDYRKSRRTSGKNKHYSSHGVPFDFFKVMPQKINNASMIIDNGEKITIITDYLMNDTKGNLSYVIVGVAQNQEMENNTVNLIKSVYPLDDFVNRIVKYAENQQLTMINKNKANEILTTIGVQPSEVSRIISLAKDSISHPLNESQVKKSENNQNISQQSQSGDTPASRWQAQYEDEHPKQSLATTVKNLFNKDSNTVSLTEIQKLTDSLFEVPDTAKK